MLTGRQLSLQTKMTVKPPSAANDREETRDICSLCLGRFSLGILPGSESRWCKLLNLQV